VSTPQQAPLAPTTFEATRALERLLRLGPGRAVTTAAGLITTPWVRELLAADGPGSDVRAEGLYWLVGADGFQPWPALLFVAARRPRWAGDAPKEAAVAVYVGPDDRFAARTWPHERTRAERITPLPVIPEHIDG
jgi:hypothetical protein